MKYIIEGIDRLGKSTLVNNILNTKGHHVVIHYDKPKKFDYYTNSFESAILFKDPLKMLQEDVNTNMMALINSKANIIFDRGHLGECVYAPLYRKYSGDYVFECENAVQNLDDVKLILLTTSNFELCVDDGLSFNFDNKEKEQALFVQAFNKSKLNKVMIDVHNGSGGFKSPSEVLREALGLK